MAVIEKFVVQLLIMRLGANRKWEIHIKRSKQGNKALSGWC